VTVVPPLLQSTTADCAELSDSVPVAEHGSFENDAPDGEDSELSLFEQLATAIKPKVALATAMRFMYVAQ
jgi:hypothetical protein